MVTVAIKWADGADTGLPLPSYETKGSAGFDLRANLPDYDRDDGVILRSHERLLVSTGLSMEIPAGYEGQIRPRSGLALRYGVTLMNALGTIDSDYRGVVSIILYNSGNQDFQLMHGDRIGQMIIAPVIRSNFVLTDSLGKTARGSRGFGSTGKF